MSSATGAVFEFTQPNFPVLENAGPAQVMVRLAITSGVLTQSVSIQCTALQGTGNAIGMCSDFAALCLHAYMHDVETQGMLHVASHIPHFV